MRDEVSLRVYDEGRIFVEISSVKEVNIQFRISELNLYIVKDWYYKL